jgi:type II secretory pathway predicted ATPase ExeA
VANTSGNKTGSTPNQDYAIPVLGRLQENDLAAIRRLRGMYIEYSQPRMALDALADFHKIYRNSQDGACMCLVGNSGTGKSKIIQEYVTQTRRDGKLTVLAVTCPSRTSSKSILMRMLEALRDPAPTKGTETELERRVKLQLELHGIEVVIIDEFQHLLDPSNHRVNMESASWVKAQINEMRLPFVLAGLPQCETILSSCDQWNRRLSRRIELHPFQRARQQDTTEYLGFLKKVSDILPFTNPAFLIDGSFAARLLEVTQGRIGLIMRLIVRAAEIALVAQNRELKLSHFSQANKELQRAEFNKYDDPFYAARRREPPLMEAAK